VGDHVERSAAQPWPGRQKVPQEFAYPDRTPGMTLPASRSRRAGPGGDRAAGDHAVILGALASAASPLVDAGPAGAERDPAQEHQVPQAPGQQAALAFRHLPGRVDEHRVVDGRERNQESHDG
jgi:hypothetical protein